MASLKGYKNYGIFSEKPELPVYSVGYPLTKDYEECVIHFPNCVVLHDEDGEWCVRFASGLYQINRIIGTKKDGRPYLSWFACNGHNEVQCRVEEYVDPMERIKAEVK